jgi:hypothetical protein
VSEPQVTSYWMPQESNTVPCEPGFADEHDNVANDGGLGVLVQVLVENAAEVVEELDVVVVVGELVVVVVVVELVVIVVVVELVVVVG